MNQCKRCGRIHKGICGIPAGVTKGFGARVGGIKNIHKFDPVTKTKLGTDTLQGMLAWGEKEKAALLGMLKVIPHDMEEYNELLAKLEKLDATLVQIRLQLVVKEGMK